MGRKKSKLKQRKRRKYKGVQKSKYGRYVSFVWDPFKKKCVWFGTYDSPEKASEMYISKKNEFHEELRAKQGIDFLPCSNDSEKSAPRVNDQEGCNEERSQKQFKEEEAMGDDHNTLKEQGLSRSNNSGDEETEFGVLFGVRVIDRYGFLLGEFSKLDDLSYCSFEDQMVSDCVCV